MYNKQTISKLEAKLPQVISQKWIDKVVDKNYKDATSDVKFEALLAFLTTSKEKVKYNLRPEKTSQAGNSELKVCYLTGLSQKSLWSTGRHVEDVLLCPSHSGGRNVSGLHLEVQL